MTTLRARKAQELRDAEDAVAAATAAALRAWLPDVRAAVLGDGLVAAAGDVPPDPAAAAAAAPSWLDKVRAHIVPVVDNLLGAIFGRTLREHGVVSARAWQEQYLADLPNRMVGISESVFGALRQELAAGLEQGEGVPAIRDRMAGVLSTRVGGPADSWLHRATAAARTEAIAAVNGGQVAAWVERDVQTGWSTDKVWLCTIDARTRDDHFHADLQRVPLDGEFVVGGSRLSQPGDPKAPPGQRINCRCAVIEVPTGEELPDVGDRQLQGRGKTQAEINRRASKGAADGDAVTAAAGGDQTMGAKKWEGVLAPIGVNSGDRRRLKAGGEFIARTLPLPIMFQETNAGGHDDSTVVGRILAVEFRNDAIWGSGDYLEDPSFAEQVDKAVALVAAGLGHVSVDLADVVAELTDENGEPVSEDAMWEAWSEGEDIKLYDQFAEATLIGVTQVSKPAFDGAIITLVEEEAVVASASTAALADSAGTTIDVGDAISWVRDSDGDEADGQGTVTSIDEEAATVTVQPATEDAEPVTVAAADVTVTDKATPAEEDEAALEARVLAEAEAVVAHAAEQLESLRASAGPELWRPDAEVFANPQLTGITPMTIGPVQADGTRRVFGHIAAWGMCHVGYANKCVTPPDEASFDYFHIGEVELGTGETLAIGNLTLGGRHADVRLAYRDAVMHYDDSGAGVAVVRAYKDEFGISIAGVLTPETTEHQVAQMRRSGLSGDWRRIGGEMRLTGALAVNSGGFPIPRYSIDAQGRQTSLVAAGIVPQSAGSPEDYETIARRVFAEETQKAERRAEIQALAAAAVDEAVAVTRSALDDVLAEVGL